MKLFKRKPESPGNHEILTDILGSFLVMLIARAILEESFLITGDYICAGHIQSFFIGKLNSEFLSWVEQIIAAH